MIAETQADFDFVSIKKYCGLRETLERRIYQVARKCCYKNRRGKISLKKLHQITAAHTPLDSFRVKLIQIINRDVDEDYFPDFRMTIFHITNSDKDIVIFLRK